MNFNNYMTGRKRHIKEAQVKGIIGIKDYDIVNDIAQPCGMCAFAILLDFTDRYGSYAYCSIAVINNLSWIPICGKLNRHTNTQWNWDCWQVDVMRDGDLRLQLTKGDRKIS